MKMICNFDIQEISNGYLLNYTDRRETKKVIFFGSWKELRAQVGYLVEIVGKYHKFD